MIAILPWRRALPPREPQLPGMVTLMFPPAPEPRHCPPRDDVLPDPYGPDPVVFGSVPRV